MAFVNPISFAAPNTAPTPPPVAPRSRADLMAYMLQQGSPATPDYSSVQSPIEGVAKALTSGLQGFMANKAIKGEEAQKQERANAIADLLFGPTAEGAPDPRRDQLAALLSSGAVSPDAFGGSIASTLGLGPPPEPMTVKPGDTVGTFSGGKFNEAYRAPSEPAKPYSNAGEISADRARGFLNDEEAAAAMAKLGASTTVNVGAGDKAWDTESAKLFAKRYDDVSIQAQKAQEMLGLYDLAETGLDLGVRTGSMGSEEQAVRQLGIAMGVGDADKVAGGELLSAVQNRMALMMRNPESGMGMPGAVSDRDLTFLKEAQIGLDRSPTGNRMMLDAFRKLEGRKIEIAALADEYVQKNGQMDAGFNVLVRQYAEQNPLFDGMKIATPPKPPTGGGADPLGIR